MPQTDPAADLRRRTPEAGRAERLARLVLGALAVLLLCAAPAIVTLAQEGPAEDAVPGMDEPLADVRVEGNDTILTSAIARHIKTRPGRPPSERQIREDVRQLYATRWFLSVEPRYRRAPNGLVLIFKVIERPVVEHVEYIGNKAVKTKVLEAKTGIRRGSPFDVSANREAARKLEEFYRKDKGHAFATVTLAKGGAQLDREVIFEISEGPKVVVTKTKFAGNEDISAGVLNMRLQTKKAILTVLGGAYEPETIPNDIAALKQYYHMLGYFDVKIEENRSFHKPLIPIPFLKERSHAHIEYVIDEGLRYQVENIVFEGNQIFSEEDLRAGMKMAEGQPFNARFLNQDVDRIKDKYGTLGRLFAQVEARPVFRENQPGVTDLEFVINEDKPYRFRRIDVQIVGDNPHTKRTVVYNNMIGMRPGHAANSRDIDRTKRRLGGLQVFERDLQNGPRVELRRVPDSELAGYQEVTRGQNDDGEAGPAGAGGVPTGPRTAPPSQQRSALYEPHRPYEWVKPAPLPNEPRFFHTLSADAVLDGDAYAGSDGEPTLIRAQNYGGPPFVAPGSPLYDVSPQGDPLAPAVRMDEGLLDATIYLTEARTGRLMFGVGVNSDAGVVGQIVLSETNFDLFRPPTSWQDVWEGTAWRGAGQRFRLEAVPGSVVSRYLVSWSDPYFLNTDYSLSTSGFYFNRFYEDWDERRGGGRVSVGRQWSPVFSTSASLRLEEVRITDPDVPTPQILVDALGSNFLSTVRLSAIHDTRDSAFLPGEGHIIELAYEQAFGDFDYPRAELDARQYFTLYSRPDGGGRHILTVGGQVGWTGNDTPIFERFFAGGFQTFRGFDFRGVGPVQSGVRIGGEWMFLGTAEYMFPLMANEMIQGVVFSDFGTVQEDVGLDEFRVSVGGGLRVTVPAMGPAPLAFDWAVPIVREDSDDRRMFTFFVGFNR
ncbi:MAG TPA: BamA/TamA family outer membrane protein [Planctomycetaceae bacterium]|nr:BamA/TamA family outer membrane protein [Planctomycetaceae bacterium]